MSTPGGYQPQWQPSPGFQPPPQAFKPYVPPKEKSGTKTCLIVGGILGGVFLMLLVACIFSVYLFFHNMEKQTAGGSGAADQNPAQKRTQSILDQQRRMNEPPSDVAAAIEDLEGRNSNRINVALKWLRDEELDAAQQKKVARAIALAAQNHISTPENKIAMSLLAKWGDASIAPLLAESLREFDSMTGDKLDLLAKYNDPTTAVKIAPLLESLSLGEKARDTLRALGPEAAGPVSKYLVSERGNARTYARSLMRDFNINSDTTEVKLQLEILRGDAYNRFDAAERLAKLPVVPELQPEVCALLLSLLGEKNFLDSGKTIGALSVWGDQSCLQPLLRLIREKKISDSDLPIAFRLIGKYGSEAEIPLLLEHLDNPSRGKAAADALIEIGPACQEDVVKFFNSDQSSALRNSRRIMAAFDGNDALIVEQCIKDLDRGGSMVKENAATWLAQCDVIPELSAKVTVALEPQLNSQNVFSAQAASQAMARWKKSK